MGAALEADGEQLPLGVEQEAEVHLHGVVVGPVGDHLEPLDQLGRRSASSVGQLAQRGEQVAGSADRLSSPGGDTRVISRRLQAIHSIAGSASVSGEPGSDQRGLAPA